MSNSKPPQFGEMRITLEYKGYKVSRLLSSTSLESAKLGWKNVARSTFTYMTGELGRKLDEQKLP